MEKYYWHVYLNNVTGEYQIRDTSGNFIACMINKEHAEEVKKDHNRTIDECYLEVLNDKKKSNSFEIAIEELCPLCYKELAQPSTVCSECQGTGLQESIIRSAGFNTKIEELLSEYGFNPNELIRAEYRSI